MQFKKRKERPLLLPLGQARNESNKTHAKHQRGETSSGEGRDSNYSALFSHPFFTHTHTVHIYITTRERGPNNPLIKHLA